MPGMKKKVDLVSSHETPLASLFYFLLATLAMILRRTSTD